MSELVLLHHNEPMTTSLAIAEGTENTHKAVIQLVRKYVADLQEFGPLAFEMAVARPGRGGEATEYAYLNEPQATLLITYLRNSETVRRFKIALVKAFYEMRDRLRGAADRPPAVLTRDPSHAADLAVAADRTFRSFLRAGRSAGLGLPMALRAANRQTLERTGMDMLAELDVDPDAVSPAPATRPLNRLEKALSDWLAAAGPGPWRMKQILLEAIGMPQEHPDNARAVLAAASYLRSLGMTTRMARERGGKTGRYWYRAGALESMWDAVAVNPEKEA